MKVGYKDSVLGEIPECWEILSLNELTNIYDGTHQTPKYVIKGIPFYSVEHVTSNNFSRTKFISEEVFEVENKRVRLEKGDILMTRIGNVGTVKYLDWDVQASFYVSLALIKKSDNFIGEYLSQHMRGNSFQRELWKRIIHTAFPKKINLGELGKCNVVLPPLREQQKIAEILSTADAKIENIAQQIKATQDLKKGLMQQLLTKGIPALRAAEGNEFKESPLGEIPVSWEVVSLQDVCLSKEGMRRGPFGGAIKKAFFVEDGYQVYEQRNAIYDDFMTARYFISEEKYKELKAFQVQSNDFIVSCSGTIGKIAKVPIQYKAGVINQALLRLRLNKEIMVENYFLQQFRSESFQNKIIDSTQGGAMKNLVGMSDFRKTLIPLPVKKEQQQIADILSTVDQKLEALEKKKTHYTTLKKGLMQQLLTGKIRVNI